MAMAGDTVKMKRLKELRFKKVVRYGSCKGMNDKDMLIFAFICMIPVFGQMLFIIHLIETIKHRKVYYEEIK